MQLLTTDFGVSAKNVLQQVLDRSGLGKPADGVPSDVSRGDLWARLVGDSWQLLGVSATLGGGGASLVDLLAVAELWGRNLVAVPLLETMLLRRWIADGVADRDRPLTWRASSGRVPFTNHPGTLLVRSVESAVAVPFSAETDIDAFAPSLPLGSTSQESSLPGHCIHELETITVASGVGAAAAALDATVEYVKARHAFGRPIGQFQAVKHRLANMHIDVELARTAVICAAQDSAAQRDPLLVALERSQRAIAGAIQMHGGMGFTWDMGIHFYMRHVLAINKLLALRPAHDGGVEGGWDITP